MNDRNVPNQHRTYNPTYSNIPIPVLMWLLRRNKTNQNSQSQEPNVKQRKWTAEDYKNYEDWQARSQAIEEQSREQIKKINKKAKKAEALRDEKWQEALERLENGSKRERAESVKKLDKLIDETWESL